MTLQQARSYECFTIDSKLIFALDKNGGYFWYIGSRFTQTYGGGCFRKMCGPAEKNRPEVVCRKFILFSSLLSNRVTQLSWACVLKVMWNNIVATLFLPNGYNIVPPLQRCIRVKNRCCKSASRVTSPLGKNVRALVLTLAVFMLETLKSSRRI